MEFQTGIYQHFKGGTVLVVGLSVSSDDQQRVLYIGVQDKTFHDRPLEEFSDIVVKSGQEFKRFKLVTPITITPENILEVFSQQLTLK